MNKIVFLLGLFFTTSSFITLAMHQNPLAFSTENLQVTPVMRHVVLLKFKDNATPAQIKAIENAFAALPAKIKTITGFEWGTNVSPENLAQGFTHCYLLTFKNAADRDAYLPHPAHKEFGQLLGPSLDKVLVVDYLSKN